MKLSHERKWEKQEAHTPGRFASIAFISTFQSKGNGQTWVIMTYFVSIQVHQCRTILLWFVVDLNCQKTYGYVIPKVKVIK